MYIWDKNTISMRRFVFFFLLIIFSAKMSDAQTDEAEIERLVQSLFPEPDEDLDYADLYESLFRLYRQPLNLNRATFADLQLFGLLEPAEVRAILAHREKYGKFLSVHELQSVSGLQRTTVRQLLPFVRVNQLTFSEDARPFWRRIRDDKNKYLIIRAEQTLQTKEGFRAPEPDETKTTYLGSPQKVYVRFRASASKDYSFGFTAEKDAGERFGFSGKNQGFDFWSGHAAIYNRGRLKALIVGDYDMQFGQGLVTAAGFAMGKGTETVRTLARNSLGILPYTSVLESGYFRGTAVTFAFGPAEFTAFVSRTRRDAASEFAQDSSLSEYDFFVKSVRSTGFHRTPSELSAKNGLMETAGGAVLRFRNSRETTEIGLTTLFVNYDKPVLPSDRIYNRFDFRGRENWVNGLFFNRIWDNFRIFGEGAVSSSGGTGLLLGTTLSFSRQFSAAWLYRRYDRDFHSLYGAAFSENTRNINENGIYFGLEYRPNRAFKFNAYVDIFRFPYLKFLTDAPSEGYEYLLSGIWTPRRNIRFEIRFREENKGRNLRDDALRIDYPVPSIKRSFRLSAQTLIEKKLFLRVRIQGGTYRQEGGDPTTFGYALMQDSEYDFGKFKIGGRLALFDTDDYETRQYAYEKDVLYAFSVPAYYGRGLRAFCLAKIAAGRRLDIWLRWAQTTYFNRQEIGTGTEKIRGNRRTDVKIQLKIKL